MFVGVGTKGRLEGSDLYGNKAAAVDIAEGANPTVLACKYVPSVLVCTHTLSPLTFSRCVMQNTSPERYKEAGPFLEH